MTLAVESTVPCTVWAETGDAAHPATTATVRIISVHRRNESGIGVTGGRMDHKSCLYERGNDRNAVRTHDGWQQA
jgi:hypothetical protein